MPSRIDAEFKTIEEASTAVASLLRDGVPRSAITTLSSEPMQGDALQVEQTRSRISGFAIAGGFIGAACAILLTVLPSRRVDIVTGGMPIVTPWAFGIIVFELTALGAILATLGRMIREARLARKPLTRDYEETVANGRVVVIVDCDDEAYADVATRTLAKEN